MPVQAEMWLSAGVGCDLWEDNRKEYGLHTRLANRGANVFGLGKKKPDERMLEMISIELSMFMRWVEDNCDRTLNPEEGEAIAKRILNRERLKFGKKELLQITSLAFASDVNRINDFRKKTNFDDNIDRFCRSIGIVKPEF
jgi:hypothetical protein